MTYEINESIKKAIEEFELTLKVLEERLQNANLAKQKINEAKEIISLLHEEVA
jgi:hypothetical protein